MKSLLSFSARHRYWTITELLAKSVGIYVEKIPTVESDGVRSVYFIFAAVYKRVRAFQTTTRFDCTKAPVQRKCYKTKNKADIFGHLVMTWKAQFAACSTLTELSQINDELIISKAIYVSKVQRFHR